MGLIRNRQVLKGNDESRSAYLKTRGIEALRFWNNEILQNMEGVLCKIAEEITPPNLPFIKEEGPTNKQGA